MSKKMRAVKQAIGLSGKPVTSHPVYGYLKGEDGKFIIDEEAAPVVRQIYALCLAGNGPTKIARMLTEQRFMKLTAALEQEQESNKKRLQDLAMMQHRSDEQESEVRTFIREIRRYATIEELDEAVLNRLISRILIGEVKKMDGQKVQEVRIVYNFVGEIPNITV